MLSALLLAMGPALDPQSAERFASLALACVHREYPNKIAHVMNSDADAKPPRELTPAFYGCYDWHSSVHGHWLLARLARLYPDAPFAKPAREALAQSLTADHIGKEVEYMNGAGTGHLRAACTASPGCCCWGWNSASGRVRWQPTWRLWRERASTA